MRPARDLLPPAGKGAKPDPAIPSKDMPAAPHPARRSTALLYAAVAAGSVIGGSLRYMASALVHHLLGVGFPWGTLFVNVTGSLAIGFYAALAGPDGRLLAGPRQRHFVMTGICGGYTTFSVFSLETFQLLQAGDPTMAGLNVAVSLLGWLGAVWLGHALAMRCNRLR